MNLRVEDVMCTVVVTIKGSYSARQAAQMMDHHGISSLVVTSKKKLAGILTKKDLCTRVIAKGEDPERVKVKDIMSQPVVIVKPDAPLEGAIQISWSRGSRNCLSSVES